MTSKPILLILAAGIGSRYGGIKQIDPMGPEGETILDYSIYDAIHAGFKKVVFIIRKEIEQDFKAIFHKKLEGKIEVEYVFQEISSLIPENIDIHNRAKPWGTGHAVLCAESHLDAPFAVINADDFYGSSAFQLMARFLSENKVQNKHALVGYYVENTLSENGTVSRGVCTESAEGYLTSVVERTKIFEKEGKIYFEEGESMVELAPKTPVSMNFWGFNPSIFPVIHTLFHEFLKEHAQSPKGEFYIPYFVNHLLGNREAEFKMFHSADAWFGVTYQEDKPTVKHSIQSLIQSGKYPWKLWS
jgi:UTP-glucose-1-phosphate uridylyltransferase